MPWLLHQRVNGDWAPAFGMFSECAGGAVMYALFGLVAIGSFLLASHALWRVRRQGRREYISVLWWALAGCCLLGLHVARHGLAIASAEYRVTRAAGDALAAVWVVYGVWRVMPLLWRYRRDRGSGCRGQQPLKAP